MPIVTVLAMDGGGIRGMIPAAFLSRLETVTGRSVSELFDYVAGTSTGGILALGLGLGRGDAAPPYSAAELVELYRNEGARIFHRSTLHRLLVLGGLTGPKYPEDGVDDVLRRYFAGQRLSDARTNVMVTAYEIELRCPFFFRSWQARAPATARSHDYEAWHVARSTSAAPTYFPPHRALAFDGGSYALVDGGVYANNPALCAWVEAHDRHPGAEILVVSLGTGNENRPLKFDAAESWGLAQWAPHLVDVIFDGVSDTVDVQLDEMLNTSGRRDHYRFQTDLEAGEQAMDDTDPANVASLQRLGEKLASGALFDEMCGRLTQALAGRTPAERSAPEGPGV